MEPSYLKPLDGIRTIAISLIIVYHYFTSQIINADFFLVKYIKLATFWSWSGVDLFFVLSGFLIGRILLHTKGSNHYFKTFYLKRVFRIFPPYYLVLFAYLTVVISGFNAQIPWLTSEPHPFYLYLLYVQNFWMAEHGFGPHWLGVTWSLAVEEQFYLVLPVMIYLLNDKYIPWFLLAGIIIAPIFRAFSTEIGAYVLLPARMDALLIGVLIAYHHMNGNLQKIVKHRQPILVMLMLILFASIFLYINRTSEGIGGVFIHSILALLYGTLLVFTLSTTNRLFIGMMSNSFMTYMAKISYMVYLTHQIFSGLFHQLILNQTPQMNGLKDVIVTLMALFATLAFSTMSYRYIEKPIVELGRKAAATL